MAAEPQKPHTTSGRGPLWIITWALLWGGLALGLVMSLPTIEEAMGLSLSRYRRYRSRRASRYQGPRSVYVVKIAKIAPSGRIDREKLRLSIEQKLKRVARCYELLANPPGRGRPKVRRRHYGKTPPRKRPKKRKKRKKRKKPGAILGTAQVAIELNPLGRATSTQLRKSSFPKTYHHCFVWFFRGRKFFPPEGNRSLKLRLSLKLRRRTETELKRARKSRTTRKRGGKW